MKTKELADWLGMSTASIRLWATEDEFAPYLSPAGAGGDGKTRSFNDQDARILAFIGGLKRQGWGREQIYLALDDLQAKDWRDLPDMPAAPLSMRSVQMIPELAAENALSTQKAALMREITLLGERVEQLEQLVVTERQQAMEKQEALLRELAEVRADLRAAEQLIGLYEAGRIKPKE
jgi:DNA-binding transcriptional MerR regulator